MHQQGAKPKGNDTRHTVDSVPFLFRANNYLQTCAAWGGMGGNRGAGVYYWGTGWLSGGRGRGRGGVGGGGANAQPTVHTD